MLVNTNTTSGHLNQLCLFKGKKMKSDKKTLLDSLETKVESHIKTAIAEFQNMPSQDLLKPAKDGGWSIAQCFDHLNGYGDYYLTEIEKGIERGKDGDYPTFKSSWLGEYFTGMMDPDKGKKKFKAFKNHIPKENLNPEEVVAKFIYQQELLLAS